MFTYGQSVKGRKIFARFMKSMENPAYAIIQARSEISATVRILGHTVEWIGYTLCTIRNVFGIKAGGGFVKR